MSNPFLPHLIADPTFGYLFPHRLALAAFGVANDYQLNKHRPRLVEGQHFIKVRGTDHVERLFYTLVGLLALADLVGTPQAQTFKQALVQHTQAGGSLVPTQPASLYQLPAHAPAPLSAEAAAHPFYEPAVASAGYPLTAQPHDPAYLVAQYLQPHMERVIERSVAARVSTATPLPLPNYSQTPQDTAALIFEAQRLASEQLRGTAETLMNAQRLMADQQPKAIHVNVWQQWDSWLNAQETWAIALIAASIVALAGCGAYLFMSAAVRQVPTTNDPTQSQPY